MRHTFLVGLAVLSLASLAAPVRAEIWEFTLDPARSRIGVSPSFNNGLGGTADGTPQAPGSDVASFAGVLRVEPGDGTLRFLDGSFADALPHAVPVQPNPAGTGPAPADYGFVSLATPGGLPARSAALRDLRFDLFSDVIEHTRPDGGFRNDVEARVATGRADYTLGDAVYTFDFAGPDTIPGDDDPLGFLTTDGVTQTLRFPFYTTLVSQFEPDGRYGDAYQFNGEITAT